VTKIGFSTISNNSTVKFNNGKETPQKPDAPCFALHWTCLILAQVFKIIHPSQLLQFTQFECSPRVLLRSHLAPLTTELVTVAESSQIKMGWGMSKHYKKQVIALVVVPFPTRCQVVDRFFNIHVWLLINPDWLLPC